MITLLLIILIVMLIFGGGWGYTQGRFDHTTPVGILLIAVVVILLFAIFGGPRLGYW
jgi:hypothetical protein